MEKRFLSSDIPGFMAKVPKIKGRLTREMLTESSLCGMGVKKSKHTGNTVPLCLGLWNGDQPERNMTQGQQGMT